ncbi:hypothetical protein IAT38_002598 [Cryptococcus sp. DSM 104549]
MSILKGTTIPTTQLAAVVPSPGSPLTLDPSFPVPQPSSLRPNECLVRLTHTGVCHTDLHAIRGDWPAPTIMPLVPGHEGVGEVVAIGEGTEGSPVGLGERVGIKWMADSCLGCEFCRRGLEMLCPKLKTSGYSVSGTFTTYVVSYVYHVTPIPDSLPSAAAAPLLCAGVTTYKALKQSNTKVGDWVALPGAGGGLGHLAVQYAKAMGLRVVAIDTGAAKEKLCKALGADVWIDFKTSKNIVADIQTATDGGPHAAVVTAAHSSGYTQAISYLRKAGTLVCVGMPSCALDASVFMTVFKMIRIQGNNVGNRQDAVEALELAAAGKVRVVFEEKGLESVTQVFEDMEAGKVAGRVVLTL